MEAKEIELAAAAKNNELQTIERLIAEGVSADAKENGYHALALAAQRGHLDMVKLLHRHGAEPVSGRHPGVGQPQCQIRR